ncbi:MAG TPA: response regulator transcription factor [Ignavibacteriaceae bacterium]|nr:response regulator transcription factor [Ignavibacteriaceae bacterium]
MNAVIADPVFLVREGFKRVTENVKDFTVKGEITKASEFWNKIKSLNPDLLILDYDHPDFFSIEDLKKIDEYSPGTKILIISNHNKKENILKAVRTGALGYLTKECGEEEIIGALEAVSKGEKFFCNKILDVILEKHLKRDDDECKPAALSMREIEIIQLVVKGFSNREIADKLFLSIHTVYTHKKNIMRKLKIKSPVELVLYALDSGITD